MPVILVVDDEPLQREILKTILDTAGYETHIAASGPEALDLIERYYPSVILIDLKMEGMSGLELLDAVAREHFEPSMIIMTAHGTISSAVDAVKRGAFDYLTKPLDREALLLTVARGFERASLVRENLRLKKELYGKFRMEGIIGKSLKMQKALEIMNKIASSSATVLIRGESGTGKELIAKAIHYNSQRKTKPFTALNCAAMPEPLFESELFGYEPGAFTGAASRKLGLFEHTESGTLFLDEIADLHPAMQSKLLRALQEKEIRRIGGKESIRIDVRIIAATNKDIEKNIADGLFREDLYYRLSVVTLELPPLTERMADLPELIDYFITKYNQEYGKEVTSVEHRVLKAFSEYHWPGNIRQLASVIERAVLLNDTGIISIQDIHGELRGAEIGGAFHVDIPDEGIQFEELEKELIGKALKKAGGVATRAAKLLGMSYKTFLYRMEKFELTDKSFPG